MENMIDNTGETLHEAGGVPERSQKDFVIEHAEYMAVAGETLMNAIVALDKAEAETEEAGGTYGDIATELMDVSEAFSGLSYAIYEFRKRRDRALSALAARPLSGGWEPIETAPKDGTRFLAPHPENGRCDFWHWQEGNGLLTGWRDSFIYVSRDGEGPKVWMPLPAPPAGTDEGGR